VVTKEKTASDELTFVTQAFIDGQFVDSTSGKTYDVVSPATGETLTEVAECDDDPSAPFGGYKQSGLGREKSLHAIDHFTQLKTTWVNLG
jgi:acyl-CoA reductase-like NAD-dependent aldehyde dehydrogenase